MNKLFGNMDERFKNLDQELKYKYNSNLWHDVVQKLDENALDNAFINAAQATSFNQEIDFNDIDNAFMDDAFVEAANQFETEYSTQYFNDFKSQEEFLHLEDAYVTASALSQAVYTPEYWKDANLALKSEGLHHEYKPEYWQEAEQLLLAEKRNAFFVRWTAVATVLLLLSFITYQTNPFNSNWNQTNSFSKVTTSAKHSSIQKQQATLETKSNKNNLSTDTEPEQNSASFSNNKTVNNNTHQQISNNQNNTQPNFTQNTTLTNKSSHFLTSENKNLTVQNDKSLKHNSTISLITLNKIELTNISQPKNHDLSLFVDFSTQRPKAIHQFSIEVAKGIGNNFNATNDMSFRNTLALNYKFTPASHKQIAFGLDLGVYHQNLNDFQYEANYNVYHLEGSVDHYWYKMTYKDLVYINTNFNFYYQLHPKHTLKIGVGTNRLLTSRISTKYQSSDAIQRDIGDEWGLNDAINTIDFSLNLGYEFKLNDAFSFTLSARHGIFDKTNNTYLNSSYIDLDKSVLLGLKYNLFTVH